MPTITHAIIGGAIALLFYQWSRSASRVFVPHLVVVFALNSFIGPDFIKIFLIYGGSEVSQLVLLSQFVHSIGGFTLFAIGLSIVYYFILNSKREKDTRTPFKSIYIAIMAAALLHYALDVLDQSVELWPASGITISITTFFTGEAYVEGPLAGIAPWFTMRYLFFVGLAWLFLLIYVLVRKPSKTVWLTAGAFFVSIYAILLLWGSQLVREENDIGFAVYFLLFWVVPFALCYVAAVPRGHPSVAVSLKPVLAEIDNETQRGA